MELKIFFLIIKMYANVFYISGYLIFSRRARWEVRVTERRATGCSENDDELNEQL